MPVNEAVAGLAPPREADEAETPRMMSAEEFLASGDEDTLAEWKEGEVITMSPASDTHQDIVRFLISILSPYVESSGAGIVRPAPFAMRLEKSIREPDILYVANEHLDRLTPTYLNGAADLVMEIILPESVGRDRGEKFYEYEAAGIPEYWLIDPQREVLEAYVLGERDRYRLSFMDHEGE
ncbi:MAG: Uma2 family endonuclease, partial [Anaerolineae bacterium]|nr:Uma2 family endonuclease [Anaerolineae bacterium]